MKLTIKTSVEKDYLAVKAEFGKELFDKLNPPFPPVKLLQFDGSKKGDLVSLELNFILFRQKWISEIVEDQTDDKEFYFVDKGKVLPFFLKSWRHKHRIIKYGSGSIIQDEIDYASPFWLMTALMYPLLWIQFAYRKPIYRRFFKKVS